MSRKVFTAGEVLAAADVNSFLMDQSVMSFAGTASRGSAIPSPVEGMTTFLEDSNILSIYDGSNWKTSLATTGAILQVVSTNKTDVFTMASSTFTDITGLTVSITPKATTSRILVLTSFNAIGQAGVTNAVSRIVRDSTPLLIADAAASRIQATTGIDANAFGGNTSISLVDSPNTASAVTYKVQVRRTSTSAGTVFVNRPADDTDNVSNPRFASSITVMEIAA
jgi:hypothetical protein